MGLEDSTHPTKLPYGVLEFKSDDPEAPVPASVGELTLRPVKLSKFLWATRA